MKPGSRQDAQQSERCLHKIFPARAEQVTCHHPLISPAQHVIRCLVIPLPSVTCICTWGPLAPPDDFRLQPIRSDESALGVPALQDVDGEGGKYDSFRPSSHHRCCHDQVDQDELIVSSTGGEGGWGGVGGGGEGGGGDNDGMIKVSILTGEQLSRMRVPCAMQSCE